MKNFFDYQTAAERYSHNRPFFHPLVIGKIKDLLQLQEPLYRALDVGSGTGQSALALTSIARKIVGTDLSFEMLAQAARRLDIAYVQSPAEALPIRSNSIQLLTVSLAFHWFDRASFLKEAHRVLEPRAWLVIYNNGFYGTMKDNPQYALWNENQYLKRYPTPPRHNEPFGSADAREGGFLFKHQEVYANDVSFSVEQLASYLTTQSNVIAAVEQGTESIEDVYNWLTSQLAPLFAAPTATFPFGGSIWYLQKN